METTKQQFANGQDKIARKSCYIFQLYMYATPFLNKQNKQV